MKIELKPDAPETINCKVYPLMQEGKEITKKFLKEHAEKGYIEKTDSPWSSPWFLISKKDGSSRPVQDYRKVNEWTITDVYPLPRIETILEQLHGMTWFTTLNIRWGYHNLRIRDEDQWKTAFKIPYGLYKPRVMFFGLKNSPSTFQRFMDDKFGDLVNKYPGRVLIYMDDILICSDNLKELRQITHEILERAKELSLFFKPSKCHFEKNHVQYLGIEVRDGKIMVDLTKKNGLANWPTILPNVAEIRHTLGILGYQQPFIRGFAEIARPIIALLKKGVIFKWTDECTHALKTLLQRVQDDPVLHRPDYARPFELEVDTSQYATGAVLIQRDAEGQPRPVGYDSHTFNEAERNYPVYDRELLALVRGLLRWEHVLLSSPFPVKVYTDHNNLRYYRSPRNIARRVARYMSKLADFNFEIIHKPGATNRADALSHHPAIQKGENNNEDVTVLPDKLFVQATEIASIEDRVWEAQQKHEDDI
jgi:RNase H-like domain found in reverse transcriptase/Reverse transcriptase (RNA-dependent DNA polymerase)